MAPVGCMPGPAHSRYTRCASHGTLLSEVWFLRASPQPSSLSFPGGPAILRGSRVSARQDTGGGPSAAPLLRCVTAPGPVLVPGGVELPRNPLLLRFGGPCAWESHPADFGTICLCTPRWPAVPVGPGRCSQLGQPFRLKDSLGLSEIRSNNTWLILISFDVCLNKWSF